MFLKVYDVFVISSKKIVFCFGCGPWGPHFCISWAKKHLYLGIPFKASDCTSPSEQKFKASIARNATFQGG